jgi:hypothetical protein
MIALQNLKIEPKIDPLPLGAALKEVGFIEPSEVEVLVDIAKRIPELEDQNLENSVVPNYAEPIPKAIPLKGPGQFMVESKGPSRISVFEHAGLLQDALLYAKDRVLIMSPWITSNVVNEGFCNLIQGALRRGVKVTIAYGYKESLRDSNRSISRLCDLAKNNGLVFLKHQNTHAKVLIVDHCYVTTSFNWLSFQGSEDRTYRMEEGTKFMSKEFSDEIYRVLTAQLLAESEGACG